MNREDLIRELVNLGRGVDGAELPVVSRGFEVTGVTIQRDESGRQRIELESEAKEGE